MAFILSFINVVDIFLFASWSSKISLKSLLFAKMPLQVLSTMGSFNVILAVFFMALHLVISFFLIQKILSKTKFKVIRNSFSFLVYITISAFLIVVFLRGGLQSVPINQSAVYLYQNNTLNVAGVNPLWNFMNTLVQNKKYLNENPYNKIDKEKAKKYVKDLFKVKKDTTTSLFKINIPNIIFIALEGVNANVFKSFGAKNSFAPSLDSLFQHGFLFTEMYSAGFRSDQGMLAIYGGFPPTPVSSIAAQPEKFKHLPSLSKKIMKEEYHCSYFMGVEPEFGNLKSFLVYNGFDKLIDIKDFSPKQKTTSLGVPDEFLFHKFLNEMETVSEPFYSMIFTATTHEPFDMPFNKGVKEERQRYLNTVAYLDTVLIDQNSTDNLWHFEQGTRQVDVKVSGRYSNNHSEMRYAAVLLATPIFVSCPAIQQMFQDSSFVATAFKRTTGQQPVEQFELYSILSNVQPAIPQLLYRMARGRPSTVWHG